MSARWWALALIPATLSAQVRLLPDPTPPRSFGWSLGAARIIQGGGGHPGTLSQFDSVGGAPIGRPGDPVTVYLFADGENLSGVLHGTITARRRFDPPASWRLACDDLAHPGWLFSVSPRPTTQYALAVAGVSPRPTVSAPPALAKSGAYQYFRATADSVFARYVAVTRPPGERAMQVAHEDFYLKNDDAGYSRLRFYGIHGPGGQHLAVFSFWLHDDYGYQTPNSTGTWIVDGWGYPVARAIGNVDIYGTVDSDHDGIDEVITSSGVIRWDGSQWRFPSVYEEEPCLAHKVLDPPPGRGGQ